MRGLYTKCYNHVSKWKSFLGLPKNNSIFISHEGKKIIAAIVNLSEVAPLNVMCEIIVYTVIPSKLDITI